MENVLLYASRFGIVFAQGRTRFSEKSSGWLFFVVVEFIGDSWSLTTPNVFFCHLDVRQCT